MPRAAIGVILPVFTVLWLSGCGTLANTGYGLRIPEWTVYGGVKGDVTCIRQNAVQLAHSEGLSATGNLCGVALSTIDLPFSVVGDTLTLPWTAMATFGKAMIEGDEMLTPATTTWPQSQGEAAGKSLQRTTGKTNSASGLGSSHLEDVSPDKGIVKFY